MTNIPIAGVKIKLLHPSARIPTYGSAGASGADLYAIERVIINPRSRTMTPIRTGIAVEVPPGYEAQIRPRSGLALKHGITVLNTPGTIDSDYRGELGVILFNASHTAFTIETGDRIAQLVITPYVKADFTPEKELGATNRGEGGFGSTGLG